MSIELSKVRVFTDAIFKKASTIERMYIHLMEPERFILNHTEQVRLQDLKSCFGLVNDQISAADQITLIQELIPGIDSWENANKLLREMEMLFGVVITRNRDYTRTLYINKLRELASKAESEGDISESRRCIIAAAKLDQLDLPEEEKFDPRNNKIPAVQFTTDTKALDAEDIQHEDV